jgi:hypothetical protein
MLKAGHQPLPRPQAAGPASRDAGDIDADFVEEVDADFVEEEERRRIR